MARTTILNTSEEKIQISQLELTLEKFNENKSTILHSCYSQSMNGQAGTINDRSSLLKENLRHDHLNNEEK